MRKMDLMLWRMIKHSKAQFIAVLVVIAMGIAMFTAISLAGFNLDDSKDRYYQENGFMDFSISVDQIPASLIDDLRSMPGIRAAEGRITAEVPFIAENADRVNVKLLSMPSEGYEINQLLMREGRSIQDPNNEAVILSQFADGRKISVGDDIVIQVNGLRCSLRVVGIAYSPEFIYLIESIQSMMPAEEGYGVVYVDELLAMQLLGMYGAYNEVFFLYDLDHQGHFRPGLTEDDLIDDIEKKAEPYGHKASVLRKDQLSNALIGEEINGLKGMGVSIPILFLLVAASVIAMMVSRMVKKDRIKIGVMKAIGYSNRSVLGHYVKYALTAGLIGGMAGILLGYQIAGYMTTMYADFFEIPSYGMKIYWAFIVGGLLLSCIFCMAFGAYGARGSLRILPAESMQSESPREGKRIFLESLPFLWKRLRFSQKLVMKNVFRNKKRSLFVLMGVSLTYGTLMFTMTMPGIIDEMMVKQYEEYQTMDYNVSFSRPLLNTVRRDLLHELSDPTYVEGRIEQPFEFSVGNREKTVVMIGVASDSRVFNLRDRREQKIVPRGGQVLITENLAKALDVAPGDRLLAKSFLAGEKEAYLTVQDIVKQTMGMNAYMDLTDMGDRLMEHGAINGVYINTEDPDVVAKLREMENVSTILSSQDMEDMFSEYTGLMSIMIGVLVMLSGVLGFSIVYNATIVSIGERKMEFSSLRVMGFGKDEIFRMILSENIIISIAGIVAGIPMGYAMTTYFAESFSSDLYTLYLTPTPGATLRSLGFTVAFLLVAQFATFEKIRKLDFLLALKNRTS
jgi:putative ABC transport system permease protein